MHSSLRLARVRAAKLVKLLARRNYRRALRSGVAASVEHSNVPFGDGIRTVVDVGASRGQFALFAATRFPEARIISFEPLPEPRAELTQLLGSRIEIHPTAVGSSPGTVPMNLSRSDDSSSILAIGEEQERIFPGTDAVGSIEVEVVTLDQSLDLPLERPCLLKIDVQGLELEVLQGAAETLANVDEALIECSFIELYQGQAMADEVVSHALGAGLRLVGVHSLIKTADGRAIQADLHFQRPSGE